MNTHVHVHFLFRCQHVAHTTFSWHSRIPLIQHLISKYTWQLGLEECSIKTRSSNVHTSDACTDCTTLPWVIWTLL